MPEGAAQAPPRGPLTSPPEWWGGSEPAGGAPAPAGPGKIPGPGWPSVETIEYVTKLIVLILLLAAVPWLLAKFMHSPADGSRHAAAAALGNLAK